MIHNSRLRYSLCIVHCALCILFSCSSENKNQNTSPLFDLKKYFETQVAELKQSNPRVQKLVIQNGQAESKEMQIADWSTELKPFLETDISKPALRNSYRVDTLDASCPACHIAYVAIDSSQSIRRIDLKSDKDKIIQISIQKSNDSRLLHSFQSLTWNTGIGYTIQGKQQTALGKENKYTIKAAFLK